MQIALASLIVVACGPGAGSAKVLLRLHLPTDKPVYYQMKTRDASGRSGRMLTERVRAAPHSGFAIQERTECSGGACTPQNAAFSLNALGEVAANSDGPNFPLAVFPTAPVGVGDHWAAKQTFDHGATSITSRYRVTQESKTDVSIEDQFSMVLHGRKMSGTRSLVVDRQSGLVKLSIMTAGAYQCVIKIAQAPPVASKVRLG